MWTLRDLWAVYFELLSLQSLHVCYSIHHVIFSFNLPLKMTAHETQTSLLAILPSPPLPQFHTSVPCTHNALKQLIISRHCIIRLLLNCKQVMALKRLRSTVFRLYIFFLVMLLLFRGIARWLLSDSTLITDIAKKVVTRSYQPVPKQDILHV